MCLHQFRASTNWGEILTKRDLQDHFRTALTTALERRELRNYQLAKLVGVNATTVGDWVNRGVLPHGPVLMKLASILGIRPDELVPGSGTAIPVTDRPDAYLTGGRRALDDLAKLHREMEEELRRRWEKGTARQARSSSDAVKRMGQDAVAKRRSKGS